MATIRKRVRGSGVRYTAEIRLKSKGEIIHTESRTFDRRSDAVAWSVRREAELKSPDGIYRDITVGELIKRYQGDYGDDFGRSKQANLTFLLKWKIAEIPAISLNSSDIIFHIRERLKEGTSPATCLNDVIWLRSVFKAARSSFNIPVDLQVIEDANDFLRREGLIAKAAKRDRRPTANKLLTLSRFFWKKQQKRQSGFPMFDIMWFA